MSTKDNLQALVEVYNKLKLTDQKLALEMVKQLLGIQPHFLFMIGFKILEHMDRDTRINTFRSFYVEDWWTAVDLIRTYPEEIILALLPKVDPQFTLHSPLPILVSEVGADLLLQNKKIRKDVIDRICGGRYELSQTFNIDWSSTIGKEIEQKLLVRKRISINFNNYYGVVLPESVQKAFIMKNKKCFHHLHEPSKEVIQLYKALYEI